jgi:hypothetical protein
MDTSMELPASMEDPLKTVTRSLSKGKASDADRAPNGDQLSLLPLHREGDLCTDCYQKLCRAEAKRFTAFRIYS